MGEKVLSNLTGVDIRRNLTARFVETRRSVRIIGCKSLSLDEKYVLHTYPGTKDLKESRFEQLEVAIDGSWMNLQEAFDSRRVITNVSQNKLGLPLTEQEKKDGCFLC